MAGATMSTSCPDSLASLLARSSSRSPEVGVTDIVLAVSS